MEFGLNRSATRFKLCRDNSLEPVCDRPETRSATRSATWIAQWYLALYTQKNSKKLPRRIHYRQDCPQDKRPYLGYSKIDLGSVHPAGVIRRTDDGEIWRGEVHCIGGGRIPCPILKKFSGVVGNSMTVLCYSLVVSLRPKGFRNYEGFYLMGTFPLNFRRLYSGATIESMRTS